jgi:hypothetical protein
MFKMKPHAMKAAEKAGLDPKDPANVYKGDDGLWHVRSTVPAPEPADPMIPKTAEPGFVPSGTMLSEEAAKRVSGSLAVEGTKTGRFNAASPNETQPPKAPVATGAPSFPDRKASVPSNPVAFIRHILTTVPFPDRKSAVAFFVSQGINEGTAKTQYQRWRSEGK